MALFAIQKSLNEKITGEFAKTCAHLGKQLKQNPLFIKKILLKYGNFKIQNSHIQIKKPILRLIQKSENSPTENEIEIFFYKSYKLLKLPNL